MKEILERFKAGEITAEEAESLLDKIASDRSRTRYVDGVARLDVYRDSRTGIPEVIQTECKKPEWAVKLVLEMAKERGRAIATRVSPDVAGMIKDLVPSGYLAEAYDEARVVVVKRDGYQVVASGGRVGVLAAGTADIGVAEEARIFAQEMGCEVMYAYDVGIAGVHRVLGPLEEMLQKDVDVIIVAAGMDAVLPITVKGLVAIPVIGVPTSVGYGIGAEGIAPLLTMLQSCSPGLAVVNIDNGLGAGALAALIANRAAKFRTMEARRKSREG